ncbi:MAG: DUF1573 domain-containing protein [Bacteroidia bacterium]|nr:DUF1573 domain-containing protein [Bacteroidia bacterium]
MKSYFLMTGLLVLGMMRVWAQDASRVTFDKVVHDFGAIPKNGPAQTTFTFRNTSDAPVKLFNVRASCGCTTPVWTKETVAPGATGEIQVGYNTASVGGFAKTVTVTVDSGVPPVILTIKGSVAPSPAEENALYAQAQGNLGFDALSQFAGVLDSDKETTVTFKVKNLGPKEITFTGKNETGNALVSVADKVLIPGQKTTVTVTLKGSAFKTAGAFTELLSLGTTDELQPAKNLSVTGTLNKIYTPEELLRLPNIQFERLEYNAGQVLEGEKVEMVFAFTNTGQEDLVIESVRPSCGCTTSELTEKVVKAGQRSEIKAVFDSRGRQGIQDKTITVRSNDPDQASVILRLKVEVARDPFHVQDGPAASPLSQPNNR